MDRSTAIRLFLSQSDAELLLSLCERWLADNEEDPKFQFITARCIRLAARLRKLTLRPTVC